MSFNNEPPIIPPTRIRKTRAGGWIDVYWGVANYRMVSTPAEPGEVTSQVAGVGQE